MRRLLDRFNFRSHANDPEGVDGQENIGRLQVILVVGFILTAIVISRLLGSADRAPSLDLDDEFEPFVETLIAAPATQNVIVMGSGAVRANVEVQIVPQVQGRVVWISPNMRTGGAFAKDETLFRIDPRDYELEVQRLRAQVSSAETDLRIARAESDAAIHEWETLNPTEPAPDLVARRPQIEDKRAAVASARAQLDTARLKLERTSYSVPFAGRILDSTVELGQFLNVGQSAGRVYALDGLEVAVPLADRDLKWLQPLAETRATISTTYLGEARTTTGRADRVSASLDAQTRFASVIVSLDRDESTAETSFVPGIFVTVAFEGPAVENVTRIPTSALQENGNIWIIKDGRLQSRQPLLVQAGPQTSMVQGLAPGDEIVLSSVPGAVQGMAVRTSTPATPSARTSEVAQ